MKIAPYIWKKYKIPYVIDLRDPWKLQRLINTNKIKNIKSRVKRFIIGKNESRIFKYAYSICTVNDTMTKQYQKEYPKIKEKFITVSNGYDQEDYRNIKPKKLNEFNIVYAGKFRVSAGFRNPQNIFKAIKIINDKGKHVNFIHVGQPEEDVIELTKTEGVENYCHFVGRKSYKESLEYCKGADILLVIGGNEKSEQTGKIFDYMGCAKPIIALANKDSEITEVCKKADDIYCIDKDDIDKMVSTIIKIIDNPKEINKSVLLKEYTREYLTKKLVDILDKINMKGK